MSKFNVGDIVKCSDKNSKYYKATGVVTETVSGMSRASLYIHQVDITFRNDQLELLLAVKDLPTQSNAPSPVSAVSNIKVGDEVKYIGSEKWLKGARGQVLNVYKVVPPAGPDYMAALVQVPWGTEEIPCDSLLVVQAPIPSHYQAVSHSDQDIENHEKEPFRHSDLGTDLTGDELMESIRSICGR